VSAPLEDYALIGDCESAALVRRNGSIDWLCVPRFDSPACFAALLGNEEHGRWLLAPAVPAESIRRRYRGETLILETQYETAGGGVTVIDFMPLRQQAMDLVRLVVGNRGRVAMRMELVMRFDYGSIVPWVQRAHDGIVAIAGPDTLRLRTDAPLRGKDFRTVAEFEVAEGQTIPFVLTWSPSHLPASAPFDVEGALHATANWWSTWAARCTYRGPWRDAVVRSLITLKALTYAPTGGIVAAPTTSLPEALGGVRNWDYRYCWLRDATFTLDALVAAGYLDEARAWRKWLLRAVAGKPSQMQLMYGLHGERRLPEITLDWLPGYEGSRPVRVGNDAHRQLQLDVYGELMDVTHAGSAAGLSPAADAWRIERPALAFLETAWADADHGIWEVRGEPRHFTHSKVMAWVAFDRAIKSVERFGLPGPVDDWRRLRARIHAEVCERGFDPRRGAFVQSYGSSDLDASLLMLPLVGFLPPSDARVIGTVEAIERELVTDGFVRRYDTRPEVDGLPPGEASFLLCSFWLADAFVLLGRRQDAKRLFRRLLAIRNDLGLLAECYDTTSCRMLGNYPQAFSHVGLINTALNLSRAHSPAEERSNA
jgi:GH15 family glucan-1,4-alpha-glucosidase